MVVADNLVKVQMRGERIDELDERAGESIKPNLVSVGGADKIPSYPPPSPFLLTTFTA